jgi:hypothetical protein
VVEYWVVNLRDREVIVHRDPQGGAYRSISTAGPGQRIALVGVENVEVDTDAFLPPERA